MDKQVAKKAAKWWADHLRTPAKLDNGDPSENGLYTTMLATMLQSKERESVTPALVNAFEKQLAKQLTKEQSGYVYLGVDYDPCFELRNAADTVGLELGSTTLPWKTSMWIDDGVIKIRCGYGGLIETLT